MFSTSIDLFSFWEQPWCTDCDLQSCKICPSGRWGMRERSLRTLMDLCDGVVHAGVVQAAIWRDLALFQDFVFLLW